MTHRQRIILLASIVLYIGAVASVDFLTPLVLDVWVLYLPAILLPVWFDAPRQIVITAGACTMLLCADACLPHPRTEPALILGNLGMGLTALWLTAFAGITIAMRSRELSKASRSLMQSEERLRLAMEGTGMGTWDQDLRTKKTIWSDTHFRMLGYAPTQWGEASEEMWRSLLHPDDLDRILEAQEQACRDRTVFCAEYRILRADGGKIVWLAVFGRFLYNETGEAVRFLGVSFDITRRKDLEHKVLEITAEEQRRIGHELHDSVGQELTGMGLMANALLDRLPRIAAEQRIVARLIEGLDRVRQQVRSLSHGLVPVQVESKGLWAALDDLVASVKLQSDIQVRFDCPKRVELLDHHLATQMYRIAQEAVNNALHHGSPQHVNLTLRHAPNGLCLSIRDDGVGIQDESENGNGMGLHIMRYRAEQIGAAFHVGRAEGGGTLVTCTLSNWKGDGENEAEPNDSGSKNLDRG